MRRKKIHKAYVSEKKSPETGASVLAALVFLAILVLVSSAVQLILPNHTNVVQSASVASAIDSPTVEASRSGVAAFIDGFRKGLTGEVPKSLSQVTDEILPADAPSAQISCQPLIADAGTNVAIAYSCDNSATSEGSGFKTGGSLSGTASPTLVAPVGETAATYGITCTGDRGVAKATCDVQIARKVMTPSGGAL